MASPHLTFLFLLFSFLIYFPLPSLPAKTYPCLVFFIYFSSPVGSPFLSYLALFSRLSLSLSQFPLFHYSSSTLHNFYFFFCSSPFLFTIFFHADLILFVSSPHFPPWTFLDLSIRFYFSNLYSAYLFFSSLILCLYLSFIYLSITCYLPSLAVFPSV